MLASSEVSIGHFNEMLQLYLIAYLKSIFLEKLSNIKSKFSKEHVNTHDSFRKVGSSRILS
jgi:hypothetical protein